LVNRDEGEEGELVADCGKETVAIRTDLRGVGQNRGRQLID
jgi:hypothetical protein